MPGLSHSKMGGRAEADFIKGLAPRRYRAPPPPFSPQRESRALIMRQGGYANQHAPGGQVDVPRGPFLQTRITFDGRKGSGFPLRRE